MCKRGSSSDSYSNSHILTVHFFLSVYLFDRKNISTEGFPLKFYTGFFNIFYENRFLSERLEYIG